jgi:hypothetical protein
VLSRSGVRFVLDNARRLNSKWRNEDMAVGTWFTGADVKIVQEWKIKLLNWKHHEKVRRARERERGGGYRESALQSRLCERSRPLF